MIFQELPTSDLLAETPELASLALLDTALEVASLALAAAQPDIPCLEPDPDVPVDPEVAVAGAILQHAGALQALIGCYCRLTARPLRTTSDRPTLVGRPPDDPF